MEATTPPVDPARTALLVMDYRRAILGSVPGPDELLMGAATATCVIAIADLADVPGAAS